MRTKTEDDNRIKRLATPATKRLEASAQASFVALLPSYSANLSKSKLHTNNFKTGQLGQVEELSILVSLERDDDWRSRKDWQAAQGNTARYRESRHIKMRIFATRALS